MAKHGAARRASIVCWVHRLIVLVLPYLPDISLSAQVHMHRSTCNKSCK